jgi:hypothetical protein
MCLWSVFGIEIVLDADLHMLIDVLCARES